MRLFKWSNSNAVYIPEVDEQHREVYRLADALHAVVTDGAQPRRVQEMMAGLMSHIAEHFAHEEALMESTRYLSRSWHKQQHASAKKRMQSLQKSVNQGDMEAAMEALEYLAGFLKEHMALADRMMGSHLRNYQRSHARIAS